MYDISLIKSRINCVDYAKRIGLPINKPGDRCVSPLREGAKNPTSFLVDEEMFYDFSAGQGGDVIEFCAAYAHKGDRGAAIRDLASVTGVAPEGEDNSAEWLSYTNQLNAKTAFYHTQLTATDRDYLHSRGLSDDDIERLMIGRVTDGPLAGRLFLPYFSGANGYVCYSATRALPGGAFPDNKYMKQKRDEHCRHIPWGMQTLNRDSDTLVIAEGYFDAVSFDCQGYPVLSAITGRFSRDQLPIVLSVARKFQRVFIVYDNDPNTHAGESFAHSMADILIKNHIPFVVGTVPTHYHDISEYYAAGGDLSRIINAAQDGLQYVASNFRDFEDLERFLFPISRYVKRSKLDDLFSHLSGLHRWNEKSLATLYKSCTSAPGEPVIAEDVMRKYQLLYLTSVGFYEYTKGRWVLRSDDHIKGYIDRAYGEFSSNQRVNAAFGLLKIRTNQAVNFDRAPVWNFVNGTLDLETGVFRDHNPGDYCSFQADYPYNPDAECPAWERFIEDVTGDDPRVAELLQFIPGYVFFPDCSMEKIFVLTGVGGNGKSKYLEVLRQLFGEENCSHVTPRGLLDRFQRIQLQSSLVNLAGEIKSDIKDAEEYMKMIASGEPLAACYKGKDYVDFVPRTKLVFACNGQLASGDTSDGLTRRLILIDFKMRFVDVPDPADPYQRKKDTKILEKISSEIASGGVFNWAYQGYKTLRAVGYFTETADQETLLEDFKRTSNPILLFFEDLERKPEYDNSEIYRDYRQWCEDNGHRPVASNAFHREFKNVANREYESFRTSKNRGYRHKNG